MNYETHQITLTEYFSQKIRAGEVMDLTKWINSHGKAQYVQIGKVISETYERAKGDPNLVDRLTNAVSVYVLEQSIGYMRYIKSECGKEE